MFKIVYIHDIFERIHDPVLPDTGGVVFEKLYTVIHRGSRGRSNLNDPVGCTIAAIFIYFILIADYGNVRFHDEVMSIQEITARINSKYKKDWKLQTVSTFLSRAVKKGYLEMKRNGRSFDYYPLVPEEEYGRREIVKCVEDWGGGRLGNLIASFAETGKLSAEEREHIRGMLDGMD